MTEFLIALGLVAIIEGLVIALAPNLYQDILKFLSAMPDQDRRWLGFIMIALGAIWVYIIASMTSPV
ncbi:MAG: DUF2065 domain-containing protein [Pseudomonadota bacterium]